MSLLLVRGNGEIVQVDCIEIPLRQTCGDPSGAFKERHCLRLPTFSSVEGTKVDKRVPGLRLVHRSQRFGGLQRAPEKVLGEVIAFVALGHRAERQENPRKARIGWVGFSSEFAALTSGRMVAGPHSPIS
jgi:hypothetical protein